MKKPISILLASILVIGLAACSSSAPQATPEPTPIIIAAPTPTPSAEIVPDLNIIVTDEAITFDLTVEEFCSNLNSVSGYNNITSVEIDSAGYKMWYDISGNSIGEFAAITYKGKILGIEVYVNREKALEESKFTALTANLSEADAYKTEYGGPIAAALFAVQSKPSGLTSLECYKKFVDKEDAVWGNLSVTTIERSGVDFYLVTPADADIAAVYNSADYNDTNNAPTDSPEGLWEFYGSYWLESGEEIQLPIQYEKLDTDEHGQWLLEFSDSTVSLAEGPWIRWYEEDGKIIVPDLDGYFILFDESALYEVDEEYGIIAVYLRYGYFGSGLDEDDIG